MPIQIDLHVSMNSESSNENDDKVTKKIVWDSNKVHCYKEAIKEKELDLENIVNRIMSSDIDIDDGVSEFSDIIYDKAYGIFGKKCCCKSNHKCSKYKCKWYNNECEGAKRRFEYTNKQYRRCKSVSNRTLMINERSRYNRVKRKTRREYNLTQRQYFSDLAKIQPHSFWKKLKKK